MSHGQTWTHKAHHDPDLGEATTFPFIVYSMPGHGASIQMSFCSGSLKIPQLGLPQIWGPITLREDLQLKLNLKKSYSPCRELSNGMLHASFMHIHWGDS